MRKIFLWALIFSFLASTTPLPAQTPQAPPPAKAPLPTVAVLPFDIGLGIDPGTRKALTDKLETALLRTHKWHIINQAEMEKVLRQHNFNLSGNTSDENAVKAGQILQAQKIITGTVTLLNSTYIVTIRVTDVETGTEENAVTEICAECKIESLLNLVEEMAFKLSGVGVGVAQPSGETTAAVQQPAQPPKTAAAASKKPWYKKKWVWALVIVAVGGGVAAAAGGSGGGGGGGGKTPTTGSATVTGTPTFP